MTNVRDLAEVKRRREAAHANGFSLLRVETQGKKPVAANWQSGEKLEVLSNVTQETANTGMNCRGRRVIDIDVDEPAIVDQIIANAITHLPANPLVRRRPGSPRLAFVYGADGEPGKLSVVGAKGKVEILGNGQQLVIDGIHPSGSRLEWVRDRSPATVPLRELPVATEAQIRAFLDACRPVLGADNLVTSPGNFPPRPAVLAAEASELSGGLEDAFWFDQLSTSEKRKLVQACLDAIDNRLMDPREQWLAVLFAAADAAARGCPDAEELATEWSKRGKGWTSEQDFSQAWNSFRPGRITVGTLLHLGQQSGVDLAHCGDQRPCRLHHRLLLTVARMFRPAATPVSAPSMSMNVISAANLPATPPKRKWLYGTYLVRGAVSLLVAAGARGKSTWLLATALACASGRAILGQHVFGGRLRVLYINAEDATAELSLRSRAAMQHHVSKTQMWPNFCSWELINFT